MFGGYDHRGPLFESRKLNQEDRQVRFDASNWSAGIYFIKLEGVSDDETISALKADK